VSVSRFCANAKGKRAWAARLRYDPTLAGLHDDPRFAALVKKMGFSEAKT